MGINVVGARPTANSKAYVKDSSLSAGLLMDYIKIPGVSGFNLPDNDRPVNQIRQLEGVAQIGAPLEPGQITISLAALHRSHPTIRKIIEFQDSDGTLDFRFENPAITVATIEDAYTVVSGDLDEIIIASTKKDEVTRLAREGMVFQVGSGNTAVLYTLVDFTEGTGTDVGKINTITVSPAFNAAVGAAADLDLVIPKETLEVRCTVTGISKGNTQEGGAVSGEIRLAPVSVVGAPVIAAA